MTVGTITGKCYCGQYEITIPIPDKMNLCHCVDCRRWSGSMYSAHIMTDGGTQVSIKGPKPRSYTVKGIDGNDMVRTWCDTCGSGLWIGTDDQPKNFKAGLFEPGDVPKPTSEVFTKDMEPWETPAKGAKHFEKNLMK